MGFTVEDVALTALRSFDKSIRVWQLQCRPEFAVELEESDFRSLKVKQSRGICGSEYRSSIQFMEEQLIGMRAVLLQDLSATRRDTCWSNVPQALHTLIPAVQVDPASRIDVHRSVVSTVVSSAVKSITRAVQPQDDSRTSLAVDTAPSDEIGSPKPMHHGKHIDRSELNDSTLLVSCQPLSDATVSAQSQVSTPKIGISVLLVDQFNLAPAGNPISVKHQTNSRNGTESEASDRLALDALNTHLTSVNRSGINKSTDAVFTGSLESIVPDQDEFRSRQYTDSDLSLGDATIEDDFDIDSLF